MYISETPVKRFFQDRIEPTRARAHYTPEQRRQILERLTAAETLERYLHTKYVGQKRFSGEGGDTLIPMLDHLIQRAGAAGVQEMVMGMAHRGRLNVLVNTLGKIPADLFLEFEGKGHADLPAGDVKYHQGFSSDVVTPGGTVHLTLAFNPSHLEIVNPVVEGSVRARQHRRGDRTGDQVLPVLIHGDAAIAGQGVNQEVLNMAQTRGYYTGGTIHIVVNNQIGFTTSDPRDTRGTTYCTDIAKMVEAPILHVNGDDPETCLLAIELAMDYRQKFHQDVFIDLVCFRRYGHNEADEPMVTQPLMYKKIAQHPGTRRKYAEALAADGVVTLDDSDAMVATYRAAMDKGQNTNKTVIANYKPPFTVDWKPYLGRHWTDQVDTRVALPKLKDLSTRVTTVPDGFKLHSRVDKVIADRRAMGEGKAAARLGHGRDARLRVAARRGPWRASFGRGRRTRHVLASPRRAARPEPRQVGRRLVDAAAAREGRPAVVRDHRLGAHRAGGAGFEYGYSTSDPARLIVWEAQFGDFVNGAQVVIDQFISAGEVKWGRISGLTLLLPHGYEGQGPEHSSARPERFLQLCAQHNMQVCVPTDPGADLPPAAPADAADVPHAADRDEPEEPAAPQGSGVVARRSRQRQLAERHRRDRPDRRRQGAPRAAVLGQGLLRPAGLASRAEDRRHRDRAPRAGIPVPARRLQARGEPLRERDGSRLGAGRAAEPGRVVPAACLPARRPRRQQGARVCRSPDLGVAGGRLCGEARRRTETGRRRRIRRQALERRNGAGALNGRPIAMRIEVKVPQLPESVAEATLVNWHKAAGQPIKRDENLIDIETDKVVLELPAPADGVMAQIVKADGSTVTSGEVIAIIDTDAAQAKAAAPAAQAATAPPAPAKAAAPGVAPARAEASPKPSPATKPAAAAPASPVAASATASVTALPAARKLMAEQGIAAGDVDGSGRGGRITKSDVESAVAAKAAPAPAAKAPPRRAAPIAATQGTRPEQRVPMSRLRARIAERLVQSQATAAILTTFNEVNMQPVIDLRNRYKERFEKEYGVKLGFMSFFVKAAVHALKKFPLVNASIDGNDIVYHGYYDIGIAVGSPRGLVVPILRDADQSSIAEIEKQIADFGKRAQDGKLTLEELTGGTFSISNGGVFGSMMSTPIINPPQSAILGVHATKDRAVVENGQVVVRPMNYLALSYDHRIIDGREAVLSLVAIKDALEDPARMLLEL